MPALDQRRGGRSAGGASGSSQIEGARLVLLLLLQAMPGEQRECEDCVAVAVERSVCKTYRCIKDLCVCVVVKGERA